MDYRKEEMKLQETMQRTYLDKRGLLTLKGYDKLIKDFIVAPLPWYVLCKSRSISRPNFEFALTQLDEDVKNLFYNPKIQGLKINCITIDDPLRMDDPLVLNNMKELVKKKYNDIASKLDMKLWGESFMRVTVSKENGIDIKTIDPKDVYKEEV